MRVSFTIIEVIISVVILALVGIALLRSAGENIDFLEKISQKNSFITTMSIVLNHENPDYNHLQKSLDDFLDNSYAIDDLELQKILKNTKFHYSENFLKLHSPMLQENELEESSSMQGNIIDIALIKLTIKNDKGGDYLYIAKPNE